MSSLTQNFEKPDAYNGTQKQYDAEVMHVAQSFRHASPHADRGFHPGGIYYPLKPEHVKQAVALLPAGPK